MIRLPRRAKPSSGGSTASEADSKLSVAEELIERARHFRDLAREASGEEKARHEATARALLEEADKFAESANSLIRHLKR